MRNKVLSDDLVVMDNALINSAYSLSLNEQRLVLSAITKIPKGVAIDGDTIYCVGREDFLRLGVDPYTVAREIRTATKDLMKKTITIKTDLGEYEYQWLQAVFRFDREAEMKLREKFPNPEDLNAYMRGAKKLNFIEAIRKKFDDDDIVACLVFSRDVATFLTDIKDNFTQFSLEDLAGFSSAYSVRIYQLMMQFKSTGYRKIKLSDLRYMLALGTKYQLAADLKRWVVDTAISEINDKSPYNVTCELFKTGKKFTHLELKFKKKVKGLVAPASTTPDSSQKLLEAVKGVNRCPDTPDMFELPQAPIFPKITPDQARTFSKILANDVPEISDLASPTDSHDKFAIWIGGVLLRPSSVEEKIAKRIFKALREKTSFKG